MRKDMGKVVIERPRRGSHMGYGDWRNNNSLVKHALKNLKITDLANDNEIEDMCETFEMGGMEKTTRIYGWDRKDLSDLLGPVRRFLQSKVGCEWDMIWSEVCQTLRGGVAVEHVRQHVRDYVEFAGDVGRYFPFRGRGVADYERIKHGDNFYVDEEGLLRAQIHVDRKHKEYLYKSLGAISVYKKVGDHYWRSNSNNSTSRHRLWWNKRELERLEKRDKEFRYYVSDAGDEFVYLNELWYTFDYKKMSELSFDSGDSNYTCWKNGIGPDNDGFDGVRSFRYDSIDLFGNISSETINSNGDFSKTIRVKIRQASHNELKKNGLSNID